MLQVFKLALWSTLVFFEHGSELQLATALVTNVMQLCVHVFTLPFGGKNADVLNLTTAMSLMLTTPVTDKQRGRSHVSPSTYLSISL